MYDGVVVFATAVAALGSGLIGGVFFAFATFIMRALARLHVAQGVAAMQSINVTVLNPWFLLPFVATAALSIAVGIAGATNLKEVAGPLQLGAGLFYGLGVFAVTTLRNVPLNDELAAVESDSPEALAVWDRYLERWSRWNVIRTLSALTASVFFVVALIAE